jgi:hypothetical protein
LQINSAQTGNVHNAAAPAANMSHKNQEISILTIKKRQSEVNISSTSHRGFQRRKDKTEKKRPRNKKQNKTRKQYEQQCQSHTCSG